MEKGVASNDRFIVRKAFLNIDAELERIKKWQLFRKEREDHE